MKNKVLLFTFLMFVFMGIGFAQTNWYVNGLTGTDDLALGRGTAPDAAFRTIQFAIDNVLPNVTIHVAPTTYTENVTVNKTLTLRSEAGTYNVADILQTKLSGASRVIITANNVTIDGFVFTEITGLTGEGVVYSGANSGVTISDNKFYNFAALALNTTSCSNWTISGNLFDLISGPTDLQGEACYFSNMATVSITGNTFSNLGYAALQFDGTSSDATITGNTFSTIVKQGINFGAINNATITGNTMTSCNTANDDRGAIRMYASSVTGTITISNNIISNTGGSANTGNAIVTKSGTGLLGATVTVVNNNLAGNLFGVKHNTTGLITATENWWGNVSGPLHSTNVYTAPGGNTNRVSVSDNVSFFPWWGSVSGTAGSLSGTNFGPVINLTHPGTGPYFNIQLAIDNAATVSGDIIQAAAGSFTENVTVNKSIILRSEAGTYDVADILQTKLTGAGRIIITANNVTVDGFVFTAITGLTGEGVVYSMGTSGVTISDNKFANFAALALNTTSCSNWTISGNIFDLISGPTDLQGEACYFSNMATVAITGNTFSNLGYAALQFDGTSSDATITGNTFSTIVKQGINFGAINNATISNNTMTACNTANDGRGAIRMYSSSVTGTILISNNIISNTGGTAGTGNAIVTKPGTGALTAAVTVVNNNFGGNAFGINYSWLTGGTIIDAINNTWGVITNHAVINSMTTNHISFIPWTGMLSGAPQTYWPTGHLYELIPGFEFDLQFAVTGTPNFQIYLSETSGPENYTTLFGNTPTSPYHGPDILQGGHTYYWVASYSIDGNYSDFSAEKSFTIDNSLGGTPPAAVPCWPTNNAVTFESLPTLEWYLAGSYIGSVNYDIELFDLTVPATFTYNAVTGNTKTVTTALVGGHSYKWHVRANGTGGSSAYSDYAFFSVDNSVVGGLPPTPVPTWPVNNAALFLNSPTLEWYLGGNFNEPVTYDVIVYDNLDLNTPVWSATGISVFYVEVGISLTAGHSYSWKVRAHGSTQNSSYSALATFNIDATQSGSPVPYLAWPVGGPTIFELRPVLEWYLLSTPAADAHFEIEVKEASVPFDGTTAIVATPTSANTYQVASDLLTGTSYHWRVRLISVLSGNSAWSDGASFSTSSFNWDLSSPRAGSPVNGVNIPSSSVKLSWYLTAAPVSGQLYRIELSRNPNMTSPVLQLDNVSNLNKVITAPGSGNYYWRVSAKNSSGQYSGFSNKGSFHVNGTTGILDETSIVPSDFVVFQNYPNPFNPSTTIKYGLPIAANVSIRVYDMLGQEVKTLVNDFRNAGTFSVIWNGDNNSGNKVSSGAYIFRVVSGSNVKTMKMILMK